MAIVGRAKAARLAVVIALAGAAIATPATSFAQSAEDQLLATCYAHRRQGRYREALAPCQEAARVAPSGRTWAQLALVELGLQQWIAAAEHLGLAENDRAHPWVLANRSVLEEAWGTVRPHVGVLVVETNEPSTALAVDGHDVGTLPRATPLYLAPGHVTLRLRAPSGAEAQRELDVRAGEVARASVQFETAAVPVTPPTTPAPSPALATSQGAVARAATGPTSPPRGGVRVALAWTSAGLAAASWGLALIAWRVREGVAADFRASCPDGESDDAALVARCATQRDNDASRLATWDAVSVAGLVAGAVFAGTATALFALRPRAETERSARLRCGSFATVGAACALQF